MDRITPLLHSKVLPLSTASPSRNFILRAGNPGREHWNLSHGSLLLSDPDVNGLTSRCALAKAYVEKNRHVQPRGCLHPRMSVTKTQHICR